MSADFYSVDPKYYLKSRFNFTDALLDDAALQGHGVVDFKHIFACCAAINLGDDKTARSLWQIVALSKNVQLLINFFDKNPDARNSIDGEKRTVFHYLALSGDFDCLHTFSSLYPENALLDVKDSLGNTVLHYARHAENQEMIAFLNPRGGASCCTIL